MKIIPKDIIKSMYGIDTLIPVSLSIYKHQLAFNIISNLFRGIVKCQENFH
jgi:hypothetical protein